VKKIRQTTADFFKNLQQLFWQNYCRLCNNTIAEDEKYFCSDCWQRLGSCVVDSYCFRCGKELSDFAKLPNGCPGCFEQNFHFESISCVGIYREPLRSLIIKFKLADKTGLLKPLANLAQGAIERTNFSGQIDFVVPVPLHWRKRFKRGFNQAALIARELRLPDAKLNTDLVRIRYTEEQSSLSAHARMKNIKGAFAVRKNHNLVGKNICLVDDIKTTGATLNESAKVLKEAGADKVFAFVLAVAGQKDNNAGD